MFGLLKSKGAKVADSTAEMLQPAFTAMRIKNSGRIPERAVDDEYLIAYMFGAFNIATKLGGIGYQQLPTSLSIFFQHFFPTAYQQLPKMCIDKSQNEQFRETAKLGASEFHAMLNGHGALDSLLAHISEKY